mmetsp:Transcript_6998/g.30752  ORF Transcript_6998/g.30752 Transcript_6998/m.30752 type:complete len:254 (-) Transcript_6998:112-873(-)
MSPMPPSFPYVRRPSSSRSSPSLRLRRSFPRAFFRSSSFSMASAALVLLLSCARSSASCSGSNEFPDTPLIFSLARLNTAAVSEFHPRLSWSSLCSGLRFSAAEASISMRSIVSWSTVLAADGFSGSSSSSSSSSEPPRECRRLRLRRDADGDPPRPRLRLRFRSRSSCSQIRPSPPDAAASRRASALGLISSSKPRPAAACGLPASSTSTSRGSNGRRRRPRLPLRLRLLERDHDERAARRRSRLRDRERDE